MIHSGLVNYHTALEADLVDIESVQRHPDNPNNGDIDEIVASIETNGMYHCITVQDSTGYIIRGNHTWEACKMLGAEQIPVKRIDCDDTHALRIMLADNKIAALAIIDPALELPLLEKLNQIDSLYGTGYSESDLALLRKLGEPPAPQMQDFSDWPTLCVQVPPETRRAYMEMTQAAGGDTERFHLLMRLAGWSPE